MSEHWTPAEQAMIDQQQAMLTDHVRRVREHWERGDCRYGGADEAACVSQSVSDEVDGLSCHDARVMYVEAVIRMAKAGEGDGGQAQGG